MGGLGASPEPSLKELAARVRMIEQWVERLNMVFAQLVILDFSKLIERYPELAEWAVKYVEEHYDKKI